MRKCCARSGLATKNTPANNAKSAIQTEQVFLHTEKRAHIHANTLFFLLSKEEMLCNKWFSDEKHNAIQNKQVFLYIAKRAVTRTIEYRFQRK